MPTKDPAHAEVFSAQMPGHLLAQSAGRFIPTCWAGICQARDATASVGSALVGYEEKLVAGTTC